MVHFFYIHFEFFKEFHSKFKTASVEHRIGLNRVIKAIRGAPSLMKMQNI
jgi:hypothetical protein